MDSLLPLSSFITARRIRTECVTVPSPPRPRDPTTFVFSVCDQTGRRTECGNALASPPPRKKRKGVDGNYTVVYKKEEGKQS